MKPLGGGGGGGGLLRCPCEGNAGGRIWEIRGAD